MTLLRLKPLRARRPEIRRSERVRDPAYMELVRALPCALSWLSALEGAPAIWACLGPVEADHAGPRPLGRKCHDRETIPLCSRHHRQRTDYRGYFRGWDGARMRQWCDEQIANARAKVERLEAALRRDFPW